MGMEVIKMDCPKCSNHMKLLVTDSRQEWCEETYSCKGCNKSFCRRIEYQTQSELIENDTIEEIEN